MSGAIWLAMTVGAYDALCIFAGRAIERQAVSR